MARTITKDNVSMSCNALRLLIERDGTLPINIKLCIEGEEESGSHGLEEILKSKSKELQADYLAIVDLDIPNPTTPAITLGISGIVTMDVSRQDRLLNLHSCSHGGIVYNPLHALVELLSKLRDNAENPCSRLLTMYKPLAKSIKSN